MTVFQYAYGPGFKKFERFKRFQALPILRS